jgi:hypothetical protein
MSKKANFKWSNAVLKLNEQRRKKHHEISLEDLQQWIAETDVTYANSHRERKRLVCDLRGNLKVLVAGKIVWQGMQPFDAVDAYNAITDKYIDQNKDFEL